MARQNFQRNLPANLCTEGVPPPPVVLRRGGVFTFFNLILKFLTRMDPVDKKNFIANFGKCGEREELRETVMSLKNRLEFSFGAN